MSTRDLERRLADLERAATTPRLPRITAIVVNLPGANPDTLQHKAMMLGGRVIDYRECIPADDPPAVEDGTQAVCLPGAPEPAAPDGCQMAGGGRGAV